VPGCSVARVSRLACSGMKCANYTRKRTGRRSWRISIVDGSRYLLKPALKSVRNPWRMLGQVLPFRFGPRRAEAKSLRCECRIRHHPYFGNNSPEHPQRITPKNSAEERGHFLSVGSAEAGAGVPAFLCAVGAVVAVGDFAQSA